MGTKRKSQYNGGVFTKYICRPSAFEEAMIQSYSIPFLADKYER